MENIVVLKEWTEQNLNFLPSFVSLTIAVIFCAMMLIGDKNGIGILISFGMIGFILSSIVTFVLFFFPPLETEGEFTRYQNIYFSEENEVTKFLNKYEIYDQDGEVYKVKLKEENN